MALDNNNQLSTEAHRLLYLRSDKMYQVCRVGVYGQVIVWIGGGFRVIHDDPGIDGDDAVFIHDQWINVHSIDPG